MLVLPAELTSAQAQPCLNMLLKSSRHESGDEVLVDATALVKFDSSALAVLLECRRHCFHDGKRFAVQGLAPRLRELAELYGVSTLLPEPGSALTA
ncbi:STAS domain-containing protein [Ottowia thiooxydans]|uniref:Phospholipid transport system transporter-binding protein n=1 Tax=Ottowia thiooxydans TaxID=219182 RepID=A0ABV2QCN3_9BURK